MKVPKARKLKSGSWFIQLRLGGASVPVTASTEKECTRQAQLVKAEYMAGRTVDAKSASVTLKDAVSRYIESKSNVISPSTKAGYLAISKCRFKAAMGKKLQNIDWQKEINAEAKLCSAKTLRNAWGLMSSVIRFYNLPVPTVTLPQIVGKNIPWLTPDDLPRFIQAIKGKPCEIFALLALSSLRRSEILALTWQDINLDNNTVKVSGAAVIDEHRHLVQKKENKNRSSNRIVPIMIPELKTALGAARGEPEEHVVTCHANTAYKQINSVCAACELPLVGVHGLRHSFASLAYHLGMSEAETMAIGGWADAATMRKIYTHLSAADRAKAENKMAEFYKNANENANKI